jgi:hypothetical protein
VSASQCRKTPEKIAGNGGCFTGSSYRVIFSAGMRHDRPTETFDTIFNARLGVFPRGLGNRGTPPVLSQRVNALLDIGALTIDENFGRFPGRGGVGFFPDGISILCVAICAAAVVACLDCGFTPNPAACWACYTLTARCAACR